MELKLVIFWQLFYSTKVGRKVGFDRFFKISILPMTKNWRGLTGHVTYFNFRAKTRFLPRDALSLLGLYRMSSVCLSVRLSVCDVGGSWPHRLKILETNCGNN